MAVLLTLLLFGQSMIGCCSTKASRRPTTVVVDKAEIKPCPAPKRCYIVSASWMLQRIQMEQALKSQIQHLRDQLKQQ